MVSNQASWFHVAISSFSDVRYRTDTDDEFQKITFVSYTTTETVE